MLIPPKDILDEIDKMAETKYRSSWGKIIILGVLAGIYISMGGLLSLLVGYGMPGLTAENPGLQRLLSGITFPIGLILVVMVGAELFTGNNATLIPATLERKIPRTYFLKNWGVVFISNFLGSLFFVYLFVHLTGIVNADPWHSSIIEIAKAKVSMDWLTVFLKGIGANWLVCLAVWLGMTAKDSFGRMLGLWWPVMAFVTMGYEHSIANMFYVPLGIFQGADVSWCDFFLKNLVPSALGNIVGGALFVGGVYWLVYRKLK